MREIKFRAWDIVWGKMRYNKDLWDIPYNEIFIHTPDQRALNLMQYIGIKDEDAKDIYEGDILDYGMYGKFKVVFNKASFKVQKLGFSDGYLYLLESCFLDEIEVIGNIYENPELIG